MKSKYPLGKELEAIMSAAPTSKQRVSDERLVELIQESRIRRMTAISNESEREWLDVHHSLIELMDTRAPETTAEGEVPAILFDGHSVLQMLTQQAKARTGAENVSDVLDALVRILRGRLPEKAPAPTEKPAPASNQQASREFRDGPIHAAVLGQCIIIEANDPYGDDSEVCLNLSEARAFRQWLGIVFGGTTAPTSNEQGPLWTPTLVVERLLRQTRLSTADQITMDRKQIEGLLFDLLRCRNDHSVGGAAVETTTEPHWPLIDTALQGAANALPVLFTMLTKVGLREGAMVADEINGNVLCAIKQLAHVRRPAVKASAPNETNGKHHCSFVPYDRSPGYELCPRCQAVRPTSKTEGSQS